MEAMIWLAGQLPALMKKAQWLAVSNLDDWQASWIQLSGFRTGPHWLAGSDDGRSHEGHQRLAGPVDGLPTKAIPNWKRREAADQGFLHLHTKHIALCHKSENVHLQLFRPSNCQNMMHCVFVKYFTIYTGKQILKNSQERGVIFVEESHLQESWITWFKFFN